MGIILLAYGTLVYEYLDKSVQLQIDSYKIEARDDVVKWEVIHDAFVDHQEYHKGKLVVILMAGAKKRIDVAGLELRPNDIARELSIYWGAWKPLNNS